MSSLQKPIFSPKILQKSIERHVSLSKIEGLEQKRTILANWNNAIETELLKKAGEFPLHGDFLIDIFCNVLGYKRRIESPKQWNLAHEQKTKTDATKADGALGFFTPEKEDIRVVIELKDANTDLDVKQHRKHDKRTPIEQAFSYAHKSGKKCRWVIVSNYKELRLYHADSSGEYEQFLITELINEDSLKRFYYVLSSSNLISEEKESIIDALYRKNEEQQEQISEIFYARYKKLRIDLFEHLKANNPGYNEIILLEKAQKLLDRFIFICFCEDTYLLPQNIFREVVHHAQHSFSFTKNKVWQELKDLFRAMDRGYLDRKINAFNGGLFAEDEILDFLKINNVVFEELALLTDYDFDSDLSVNILGHIFEQSVSDLEELKASIRGEKISPKKGKRQTVAIRYTPEHITHYIVEKAVGWWTEEQKRELKIEKLPELSEKDYASIKTNKRGILKYNNNLEKHITFWERYKNRLMHVKILDPACGSGAFLNQAFNFLYKEGQYVNKILADFRLGQTDIFDLDKYIVSNNLYGVDLNRESVQITKLSLWLKTANKHSPLTALDNNIQCGNSLVDNPIIGESKAFNWEKAFLEIMANGGFDIVIGNPPYEILSEKETGIKDIDKVIKYFKNHDILKNSIKGKTNVYKTFICRALSLTKEKGFFSFIVPMALIGDNQAVTVRKYLLENSAFKFIECFPQKDNPQKRIFKDAKLSTVIFGVVKENSGDNFYVRSHPGKYIETPIESSLTISKDEILKFDKENLTIPSCTNDDWKIVRNVIKLDYFATIGNFAKQYQGEVNETVEKKKGMLVKTPENPLILRGSNITMYAVREASQGELYYLDDIKFLTGKKVDAKAFHHQYKRIGFQRSSPQNNFRRLIAAPINPGNYCFDTVSYVTEVSSKIDLDVLLVYLNCNFADWFFRLSSTNSKVNAYQFNNLPFFYVTEVDFPEHFSRLLENNLYSELIIKLREVIENSHIIPSWIFKILKQLSINIQREEQSRKLKKDRAIHTGRNVARHHEPHPKVLGA